MKHRVTKQWNQEQRHADGMTATLVRGDELLTIVVTDAQSRPLAHQIAAVCDAGGWKIQTLSTPATVLRDLTGSRAGRGTQRINSVHLEPPESYIQRPETRILGGIGRMDLLA